MKHSSTTHKGRDHSFFKNKTLATAPQTEREVSGPVGDLWIKCPRCSELSYVKEHEKNFKVCQKCKYHSRLRASERIAALLDPGSWVEINAGITTADPLQFASEGEDYPQKIGQTRQKSGINESLITGHGQINGQPVGLAVADFAFLGASMGSVFGEKMVRLIEFCIEQRLPLVTVSASGGARMHEGLFSLMQMAKTTAALGLLGQARLPHISLLTDPCYGGVTASYAMVADVILAEPGAMIGFAGPRVIEQTTRQKLPGDFQTAEFLMEHGMVDRVVPRKEQPEIISRMLKIYARSHMAAAQPVLFTITMPVRPAALNEEMRYAS